jgi:hypothetical protein
MPEAAHRSRLASGAVAVLVAASLAGCASANKAASTTNPSRSSGGTSTSSGMSGMSGMSGGSSASSGMTVNGVRAVPSQLLATADWQGMKIQARTMTAAPFVIFNGTSEREIKPTKSTSFHLMVVLSDAHTGVAIPYAGVWATFSRTGKVVYDERQWPMLSAFMGPHYGNNVSLPAAGRYTLTLLISPPVSARHLEYQNVWLHPHRVTVSFNWKPAT